MSTDMKQHTEQVPVAPTPPRTRWAAIVWGLCFAGLAATGLWLLTGPDRGDGIAGWATTQTLGSLTAIALLCVGALVLIGGAIGLIRHAQRRRGTSDRRATSAPAG
jgi:hypothetical protein